MKFAQILDCTLRDGGYLVDKTFGEKNIHGIINGLTDMGIDIIEVGFLQNEGFGEGKTVFKNSVDAKKYLPKDKKNSIYTAFADYSRYDVDNLDECTGESFEAVRACFFKHERFDAMTFCRKIKEKGYLLFVQPVDIMGYSDDELIELINMFNGIEPYCFSIVDTFGSMYEEDLQRLFSLVNHNLIKKCKVGFHSHNNLQLSSSLSQDFLRYSYGKREVIVDTTILGMGRGAGNTPTELIVQYMNDKLGYNYRMDALLDLIDKYMYKIQHSVEWGYNIQLFLAGVYSAHVNNISYLKKKNGICSKDIGYVLNDIGKEKRKKYDYTLLEKTYVKYAENQIDDKHDFDLLRNAFQNKCIVVLAAGKSINNKKEEIKKYIADNDAITIAINYDYDYIKIDYFYISNKKKYDMCKEYSQKKIITSNIKLEAGENEYLISFKRLMKCGWENSDNSMILLIRLLNMLGVKKIGIAGFDGYDYEDNYANKSNDFLMSNKEITEINRELSDMLRDFVQEKRENLTLEFVTESRLNKF